MKSSDKPINFKDTGKLTRLDNKHRVSLGAAIKVAETGVCYRVLQNDLGQVLLDPIKFIPAYEAWIYENPTHIQSIKRGIAQAEAGLVVRMPVAEADRASVSKKQKK